jgi:alanyl-tRNA synthetase
MVIGSESEGKVMLSVMLGDDIVAKGLNAGEIVREAAREINGGGGGTPFFATAGGKKPDGLEKAMTAAVDQIKNKLN